MADGFKKGDIVRIDYSAYIADINRLYDTTDEKTAKDAGIYNEKYKYAPMPYIIGSKKLFKPLDEAIEKAVLGKEAKIEIDFKDAAGPRDPKLMETYPIREFHKQEINPQPGLEVKLGNRTGVVMSAGAGRVKVDFNNPLAGKDLAYVFTVRELVTEPKEKAKAVVEMNFGSSEGFEFTITDKKVSILLPDVVKFSQEWPIMKYKIVADMREAFSVGTIEFVEVWAKTEKKDEKKEDKKDEKKDDKKDQKKEDKKGEKKE